MRISGSNMETLARIDESAAHYEREAQRTENLLRLKHQIQRVRDAIAQLDKLINE